MGAGWGRRVPPGPDRLARDPLPAGGSTGLHRGDVGWGPDVEPLRVAPSWIRAGPRGSRRLRAPAQARLAHPLRVLACHGTADRINPLAGSGTEWWNESVSDAAEAWARALGLEGEPTHRELTSHLTRVDFGDPNEAAAVTLFVSRGAGHTRPGSRLPLFPISLRLILGRTSKEVDATAEIWRATSAAV
jgi:poly(3-hydroxybutyrate) depolymerase